jgi:hypothetical protein
MSSSPAFPVPDAVTPEAAVPQVDVRGPRFGAWVTTVVLAIALVTGSGWLVAAQAVVFAVGAFAGLRYAPYGVLFRVLVAPRLGPVQERELGAVATGFALVAALLNAATGFCLGCELYLTVRRAQTARTV